MADQKSQSNSGEGSAPAIDPKIKHRIANVLNHIAGKKYDEAKHAHDCATCLHAKTCKSPGDECSKEAADIEDLGTPSHGRTQQGYYEGLWKPKAYEKKSRTYSGDYFDNESDAENLFDGARFAETRKPVLEASTMPGEVYWSRKWFERELQNVFMDSWTLIGRADEIPEPGQYIAIDTEWTGPVAACRGNDGKIYAFGNVCCHRGAKVMPDGKGKGTALGLVCPYHAWTYDFDGKLKWAPGMRETKDFDEDALRLAPVKFEVFHGFIFVTVGDNPKDFYEALGDMPDKLAPWFGPEGKVKDLHCAARYEVEVDCNWKFLVENTVEGLHTPVVHKGSLGPMRIYPMDPHVGDWDAVKVPGIDRSVVPLPSEFVGEKYPLPAFTDSTIFMLMFPSLQINVTWDCIWWMHVIPLAPTKCKVDMGFCFPPESMRLPQFPTVLQTYLNRWKTTVGEDNVAAANQQRGVRSVLRKPGRFSNLEFGAHNFNNWVLDRVLDKGSELGRWDPGARIFTGDGDFWDVVGNDRMMDHAKAAQAMAAQETEKPISSSSGSAGK